MKHSVTALDHTSSSQESTNQRQTSTDPEHCPRYYPMPLVLSTVQYDSAYTKASLREIDDHGQCPLKKMNEGFISFHPLTIDLGSL